MKIKKIRFVAKNVNALLNLKYKFGRKKSIVELKMAFLFSLAGCEDVESREIIVLCKLEKQTIANASGRKVNGIL